MSIISSILELHRNCFFFSLFQDDEQVKSKSNRGEPERGRGAKTEFRSHNQRRQTLRVNKYGFIWSKKEVENVEDLGRRLACILHVAISKGRFLHPVAR